MKNYRQVLVPAKEKKQKMSDVSTSKVNMPIPEVNMPTPEINVPTPEINVPTYHPVRHIFPCRFLNFDKTLQMNNRGSLQGSGFASIAFYIYTVFRPAPFTVFYYLDTLKGKFQQIFILVGCGAWLALMFIVLVVFGFILLFAPQVSHYRCCLVLHSWGLLLLYVDWIAWLIPMLIIHHEHCFLSACSAFYVSIFTLMYLEILIHALFYFYFASYFIIGELTLIERFY